MKIREYMLSADSNKMYFVGGVEWAGIRSSSSFIFVGTREEFLKDVRELSQRQQDSLKSLIERGKAYIRQMEKALKKAEKEEARKKLSAEIAYTQRTTRNYTDLLEKLGDLGATEIVKRYPSISESHCSPFESGEIILIDFPVLGRYWTREEYLEERMK